MLLEIFRRGKIYQCEGIPLPDEKMMRELENDGYKYLDIEEETNPKAQNFLE